MHAILSSLFVWNLLRRGKLLSTLWPEIVLFFFIYFFPPSVPWIEVTSEQSAGNLCQDGNCNVPCFMGLQVKMICVHAGV